MILLSPPPLPSPEKGLLQTVALSVCMIMWSVFVLLYLYHCVCMVEGGGG